MLDGPCPDQSTRTEDNFRVATRDDGQNALSERRTCHIGESILTSSIARDSSDFGINIESQPDLRARGQKLAGTCIMSLDRLVFDATGLARGQE
jgi:hypothetical protein